MDGNSRAVLYLILGAVLVAGIAAFGIFANAIGGTTIVNNLEAGDCLRDFFQADETGYTEVLFVRKASCDDAHALEVYAASEGLFIGQTDFPGEDAAFGVGDGYCLNQFEAFTGVRYESSPYEMWTFVPLEESWNQGDRKVQCLIGSYDEFTLITGSLRDSGR